MLPYALQHKAMGTSVYGPGRAASGLKLRGVVLSVFRPLDPLALRNGSPIDLAAAPGVTCNVLVSDPPYRTVLKGVPIQVSSGGLNDHEVWVPRATTIDLTTGVAVISPESLLIPASKVQNLDGDHVVIEFLGDDLNQPVITGQLPHPSTNRRPTFLDVEKYKYRRHIRGNSFAVTETGNVEVDLSLASLGLVTPPAPPTKGGEEIPALNALTSGNLNITLLTGDLTTAAKVVIKDAVLTSPEPVILGQTWLTDMNTLLTNLSTYLGQVAAALTASGAAWTSDGDPAGALHTSAAVAATTLQGEIAVMQTAIVTAQAVGLPYLSSHLAVD